MLKQEPDRITAGVGMGPRVMISEAALAETGLLAPGSRASRRLLVKLPDKPPKGVTVDAETAAMRTQLEAALPDAQVMDFREGNPALSRGLDNATSILSLICLVAMVLGAIGVAMAMHAHLEQRMDMLAILEGDRRGFIRSAAHFSVADAGPGLAGGLLGVAAGVGVMVALPAAFGQLLPVHVVLQVSVAVGAGGVGNGLADHTAVLPAAAARCARRAAGAGVAQAGGAGPDGHRRTGLRDGGRAGCSSALRRLVIAALGGIAWALSDSPKVGAWFALLFTVTLVVLLVLAAVALVRVALPAQSHAPAPAFVVAPRACQSLSARQSIGRGAGGAGHGSHADPRGLSDAEETCCAICARPPRPSCPMFFSSTCEPTRLLA